MDDGDDTEQLIAKQASHGVGDNGKASGVMARMNAARYQMTSKLSFLQFSSLYTWYASQRASLGIIIADMIAERYFYAVLLVVAFVQGASSLSELASSYLYKDNLGFTPVELAVAAGIISSPWMVKPLYGFVSDTFPIFGMRRKPYFFLFGAGGFICYMAVCMYTSSNAFLTTIALLGAQGAICGVNVLAEALIVERGRDPNATTSTRELVSRLMTIYWGVMAFVQIFAGLTSGYMLEVMDKKTVFGFTALFPLALCVLAFMIREDNSGDTNAASSSTTISISEQKERLKSALTQRAIWGPMVFVFIMMSVPSSQKTFFYFLTNELHAAPIFVGQLKVVEGIASLLGLAFYHSFLNGKVAHRTILKHAITATTIAHAIPIVLILRVNSWFGISDAWFCVWTSAILAAMGQIALMPLLVLGAETCPKMIEATLYSCLMSACNIGSILSIDLGAALTWLLGITEYNFDRLWLLTLICAACTLIPRPLLALVPDDDDARAALQAASSSPSSEQHSSSSSSNNTNNSHDEHGSGHNSTTGGNNGDGSHWNSAQHGHQHVSNLLNGVDFATAIGSSSSSSDTNTNSTSVV